MRRLHLLFKRIWIKIFGVLLVLSCTIGYGNEEEQVLGFFRLGETIDKIAEKLGKVGERYETGIYMACSNNQWYFLVDKNDDTLKGISYMEINIRDDYDYPKTSQGISIGSKLEEVEQAYGFPEKIFSGRTWFVLRNSELSMAYLYLSRRLWVMFINQSPYSDIPDWRVVDIAIGNTIETRWVGVGTHSTWLITQDKKDSIIKVYEKKYGKQTDLEIYDDYILNREIGYFEYIRSRGEYLITFLMILPKERGSKLLPVIFNYNSRFWQNTQRFAKKQTALRYGISLDAMEWIIKKVEHFKTTSAYEEIVELD